MRTTTSAATCSDGNAHPVQSARNSTPNGRGRCSSGASTYWMITPCRIQATSTTSRCVSRRRISKASRSPHSSTLIAAQEPSTATARMTGSTPAPATPTATGPPRHRPPSPPPRIPANRHRRPAPTAPPAAPPPPTTPPRWSARDAATAAASPTDAVSQPASTLRRAARNPLHAGPPKQVGQRRRPRRPPTRATIGPPTHRRRPPDTPPAWDRTLNRRPDHPTGLERGQKASHGVHDSTHGWTGTRSSLWDRHCRRRGHRAPPRSGAVESSRGGSSATAVTAARATPQDDHQASRYQRTATGDGRLACVAIVVPVDMVSLSRRGRPAPPGSRAAVPRELWAQPGAGRSDGSARRARDVRPATVAFSPYSLVTARIPSVP